MKNFKYAFFLILLFRSGCTFLFACAGGDKAPIQAGKMVIGTIDISLILAFHPAMRAFDFREGRFITQIPNRPEAGGVNAWEISKEEREIIESIEESMESQVERINSELSASFKTVATTAKNLSNKAVEKEKSKLIELNNKHKLLLAKLAKKVFGEFSFEGYGNLPKDQLERIMGEINWAVQTSAKTQGAAFVLNSSKVFPAFADQKTKAREVTGTENFQENDILKRWQVNRLSDLENLLHQASGSSPLPIGKSLPKQSSSKVCGGHFESVTDPAMLKTLSGEFFDNRKSFLSPFQPLGVSRTIWRGVMEIEEKDLTFEILGNLFKLYKTRQSEQDAAYAVIRERSGKL
ncbi:hypothetical protein HYY75_10340 [bacterium]|nr:hypothetical protein [bacterium]